MPVELLQNGSVWDAFIDESPYGLLFHKWDHLKILEGYTGYTLLPYAIYKGNEIICLFPIFLKRFHGLNAVFSPPPMQGVVPYMGFVMSREFGMLKQSRKELYLKIVADEIRNELREISPGYLSLNLVPNFLDIRQFIWDRYDTRIHYSYLLNLEPSIDDIWNGLNSKLRMKLRKIEKEGFSLREEEGITNFYAAVSERFADPAIDIPMIRRHYFEDLLRAYPGFVHVYCLYGSSGELAGAVATQEYKRFLYWVGSPKMDAAANEYLQWLLIRKAKSDGYREFENIGANNPNLNRFKTQFNPSLSTYVEVYRRDQRGKMAEWMYRNILNRGWLKRRVVPYLE
ncbi:MAG: GNAT family N-acetyltransferase [Methanomicrobiaceae archaeon]|uniref:BioF2-like acetyltransferase domain-containing protein n=1 Tax=hydrocarbon metagenome TaxID=938273 RepID=A0A0W8FHD7_9ZZZZ|nr:GNAT family N-acetyltransferase [Methanomicrobiaceae archaeon]